MEGWRCAECKSWQRYWIWDCIDHGNWLCVIATTTQSNSTTSNANNEQTTPRRSSAASSTAASPKSPTSENGPPRTIKSDDVKYQSTGNGPRDKTIELMYSAVALGSYAGEYLQVDSWLCLTCQIILLDSDLLLKRALAIEKTIFDEFGSMNDGYKAKVRTLALNLKSKSNPGLRESVVSGELAIAKLCTMSVEVRLCNQERRFSSYSMVLI